MQNSSFLDHNNNSASVLPFNKNKQTTSSNQLKFQTNQNSAFPLNLINKSEQQSVHNSILYTRPPVLKHHPKINSLSSTSSSSSGLTGSSFDSTNLSIENLTALYPSLIRTDSIDKLTCDKILSDRLLSAQSTKSSLTNPHPHGKIARLERNLTEYKLNTNLNKSKFKSLFNYDQIKLDFDPFENLTKSN